MIIGDFVLPGKTGVYCVALSGNHQLIAISSGENDDSPVDGMFVFIPKHGQTKPLVVLDINHQK